MIRLLVALIELGIRSGRFPIRLVRGGASAMRRTKWPRATAKIGLHFLAAVKGNNIASTAIMLSVINFGVLMWQIWPEGPEQAMTVLSQPVETPNPAATDNTPGKLTELENQILELSREHRFQIERLRGCINYPSPFGCPRIAP